MQEKNRHWYKHCEIYSIINCKQEEEDRISNLSEEEFPEAELPENEEQVEQAEEVPRPEGQVANDQISQPQSQQAVAVAEEHVENPEQQVGNNQEVELVH